jgi:hypothetical protein
VKDTDNTNDACGAITVLLAGSTTAKTPAGETVTDCTVTELPVTLTNSTS